MHVTLTPIVIPVGERTNNDYEELLIDSTDSGLRPKKTLRRKNKMPRQLIVLNIIFNI